jgi:1-acyl-sn-glycerol-3-phosphate acyltransferase
MTSEAILPTPAQLALLTPFEQRAFHLVDYVNSHSVPKEAAQLYLRTFGAGWVYYCSRNLTHIIGRSVLDRLDPPAGLLLTSNHRSFFDQYFISCWLFRITSLLERMYFPVRAEFWYDRPLGIVVSAIMSALCMYPPVFREPGKREFNTYSLQRLVQLLGQRGAVVGMHPEGTRNKSDDPYALLKAQPGIGKLILDARPTVLPIFINGLTNDFARQVRTNFDGTGTPVVMVVGEPLDLEAYYARPNRLRTQKETADFVVAEIAKLGPVEREYRERLERNPVRGPLFL